MLRKHPLHSDDTARDREYIVRKILSTRLFDGPFPATSMEMTEGDELKEKQKSLAWRASVKDIEGEVLCGRYPLDRYGTIYCCLPRNLPGGAVPAHSITIHSHGKSREGLQAR